MRNLCAVLFVVFYSLGIEAQNVNFPDSAFKTYLLTVVTIDTDGDNYPDAFLDTNNDGEIQTSEASAPLNLHLNYMMGSFGITDITGIQEFANLKSLKANVSVNYSIVNSLSNLECLDISGAHTSTLSISGLTQLKSLICAGSGLATLNLSNLPNLETLSCNNNNLIAVNLNALTSLKKLDCSSSNLHSLNLGNLTNLVDLSCGYNDFTALDLSHNTLLENLNCVFFKGTSVNISGLTHLKIIDFYASELTSLDVSQSVALEMLTVASSDNLAVLTLGNLPNLKGLWCSNCALTILDTSGIPNVESLLCNVNHLTALNVSNMPHLETLYCQNNQITVLDVAADVGLKVLSCDNNLISTLDVSNLVLLNDLTCENNTISALNLTALTNLYGLSCDNNPVGSLDLTNTTQLSRLSASNCNLGALSISHLQNLRTLDCSNNHLTTLQLPTVTYFHTGSHGSVARMRFNVSKNLFETLDFSPINTNLCTLYLGDNPNLTYVNMKNSRTRYEVLSLNNCPNLDYICINAYPEGLSQPYGGIFQYISDQSVLDNIQINPYCSFTPGGVYNTITGTFSLDLDNNGCDAADYHFRDSKIIIDNAPANFHATYTNDAGIYNFYTQEGIFVIEPEFEHPYFTVSPATATIAFAESNSSIQTQNFCVIPNGIHKDVEVTILPMGRGPRPGFDTSYKLVYKNKGNQMLSGNINFTFDDAVLDLMSATPAVTNQSINTLNWSYSNLKPFESREIGFTLNVNSPMEIPAVNIGDILNFSASIDPASGDDTIADNTFALRQTVRGSWDPNDKICLEGHSISPEQVGGYLHYLIRFQNSGTEAAENIVIKDVIDTAKFDVITLELTSTSHPQVTKITGNKVEFQFENINLPPQIENEPASHGYVAFKIKTKPGLAIGSSVSNKADIFFDFNFPIETLPATSTVTLLAAAEFENSTIAVAPNPVKNLLHINAKGTITSVQLLDLQGRVLETRLYNDSRADFDLSQKSTGVYLVKINTDKGQKIEKIIKE